MQRDTRWPKPALNLVKAEPSARVVGRVPEGAARPVTELAVEELGLVSEAANGDGSLGASGSASEGDDAVVGPAHGPVIVQDIPSFPEVFRSYSGFVWRVLLRLGVAESDVDDVAQEVFLGIHRNLSRFEGRCSLRTWVYGICHRRAVDYRRRASVRPELYSDDPPDQGVEASQEQGIALAQARAQLAHVLDQLDEEKRTVFVLFDIEGIPMEEVAEIVACPLQTAYSRLYAARRKVEALLTRLRGDRRSV